MKLTRTDAVFSRTTMVLFLCRNKSSRNGTKLCEDFYINKEKYWSQEPPEGAPGWAQPTRARHPLQARPGGLSPPGGPVDDPPDTIKSYFSRKIREKDLSRFTRRSRRHLLFFIGRPDLEPVRGSGEGDLCSSSLPTLLHRQFHEAPHRE